MAIGTDRVQVLKQESAALGGDGADDVPYNAPISPQEDVLEAAGIFFQDENNRDEAVAAYRHGQDLLFKDQKVTGGVTLAELVNGLYEQTSSDGTSASSSTSFSTKATLTTSTLPVGTYEVEWLMEGFLSTHGILTPGQFEMQFRDDGTEEGLVRNRSEAAIDHRVVISGKKHVTVASPASKVFDLRYRVINASDEVTVARARITCRSTKGVVMEALDDILLTVAGTLVYVDNGDFLLRDN